MLFSVAQPYAVRAAVTLVGMTATAQTDGTILVEWETATELQTASFRLYRGLAASGPWTEDKIVDEQAAQGDGTTGATYVFSDDGVEAGKTYYYLLEEIENNGTSTKLTDFIRSATVSAPGQATFTPTATSTVTRTCDARPIPDAHSHAYACTHEYTLADRHRPGNRRADGDAPVCEHPDPRQHSDAYCHAGARPADGDAGRRIANRDTHHVAAVGDADAFARRGRASCASRSHTTGQRRAADCCATCGRDRDADANDALVGNANRYRGTHAISHAFAGRFCCEGDGGADLARHAGPDDCAGSRR